MATNKHPKLVNARIARPMDEDEAFSYDEGLGIRTMVRGSGLVMLINPETGAEIWCRSNFWQDAA